MNSRNDICLVVAEAEDIIQRGVFVISTWRISPLSISISHTLLPFLDTVPLSRAVDFFGSDTH